VALRMARVGRLPGGVVNLIDRPPPGSGRPFPATSWIDPWVREMLMFIALLASREFAVLEL
jgi:hypothetical protein